MLFIRLILSCFLLCSTVMPGYSANREPTEEQERQMEERMQALETEFKFEEKAKEFEGREAEFEGVFAEQEKEFERREYKSQLAEITPLASVPLPVLGRKLTFKGYKGQKFVLPGARLALYRHDIRSLGFEAFSAVINFYFYKTLTKARAKHIKEMLLEDVEGFKKVVDALPDEDIKRGLGQKLKSLLPGRGGPVSELKKYVKQHHAVGGMNLFKHPARVQLMAYFITQQVMKVLEKSVLPMSAQLVQNTYGAVFKTVSEYLWSLLSNQLQKYADLPKYADQVKGFKEQFEQMEQDPAMKEMMLGGVSQGLEQFETLIRDVPAWEKKEQLAQWEKKMGIRAPLQLPISPIIRGIVFPETALFDLMRGLGNTFVGLSGIAGQVGKQVVGLPGSLVRMKIQSIESKPVKAALAVYDTAKSLGLFSFMKRALIFALTFKLLDRTRRGLWISYIRKHSKLLKQLLAAHVAARQGLEGAPALADVEKSLEKFVERGQRLTANTLLDYATGKSFLTWARTVKKQAARAAFVHALVVLGVPLSLGATYMIFKIIKK